MLSSKRRNIRPWTFAGIMLSHWCNARCACCYLSCGPEATEWVDPAQAVSWWEQLVDLARSQGKRIRIHLSGGEPFGNWPLLHRIAALAHEKGLTADGAFQKVETNAYWASDPDLVRERLVELDRLGMGKLTVSADPYHQQFVSPECVRTCVETARQVLGPQRVQVRWLDWYERMQDLRTASRAKRSEVFREALALHPERLAGRAACQVAPLLKPRAADTFRDQACGPAILGSRHIHIDPCGRVFAGTCAGIVLGDARQRCLAGIWADVTERYHRNPLLGALIEGGPHVLLQYAQQLGFQPRDGGYAGKCQLCAEVRRFLFDNGLFAGTIGPAACYRDAVSADVAGPDA